MTGDLIALMGSPSTPAAALAEGLAGLRRAIRLLVSLDGPSPLGLDSALTVSDRPGRPTPRPYPRPVSRRSAGESGPPAPRPPAGSEMGPRPTGAGGTDDPTISLDGTAIIGARGNGSGRHGSARHGAGPDGAGPDGDGPDGGWPDDTVRSPAGPDDTVRSPAGPDGGDRGGAGRRGTDRGREGEDRPGEIWDLVSRAQNGDGEAFGLIYDRYVDVVFKFIYFRVGSRPLAEDLTSETFLRALRRIGSVSWQGRDLGAWFVTIARNLIADHYKSGRFRLEVTTADMLDADTAAEGSEGQPETAVLERLTNATLLEAVKKLNPEQQECITLRFLQGLSVTETAQIMGKNEGAIKALQYRAVRSLGRLLPEGFSQ